MALVLVNAFILNAIFQAIFLHTSDTMTLSSEATNIAFEHIPVDVDEKWIAELRWNLESRQNTRESAKGISNNFTHTLTIISLCTSLLVHSTLNIG